MDSISHTCFSYLVCRSTGTAKNPRMGLVAGAVALLPDLDFLLIPLLPEVARFAFHRGPSHSLFVAIFMGILLGSIPGFLHCGISMVESYHPRYVHRFWCCALVASHTCTRLSGSAICSRSISNTATAHSCHLGFIFQSE